MAKPYFDEEVELAEFKTLLENWPGIGAQPSKDLIKAGWLASRTM